MNYKILEQNGVTNENVDGAAFNLFCSGRKDGILEGVLNECRLISTSSNIIGIDTGVFLVQGFRVKIFEAMYWSMVASDTPGAYHLIFSLTVNKDRSVVGEFSVEKDNYLTKDQIPLNEQGLYQIQILRFDWDGESISNLSKTMPIISTQEAAVENVPAKIQASMSEDERYILKLSLTNKDGEEIADSSSEIDLPLEMAFIGAALVKDEDGNEFVEFTLQNGEKLRVGLSEIFKGKVDKITQTWKAYTTDGNGNTVPLPIAANPSSGSVVLYNNGGIIKTNAPVEDLDCVNKGTLENGLEGKYTLPTTRKSWSVLGIGDYNAETGEYTPIVYTRNAIGTGVFVATFDLVSSAAVFDRTDDNFVKNLKYTLGVPDPIYPIQVANKRYVDGKVAPLEQGLYNALGTMYITVEVKDFGASIGIPRGAMKFAYIDSLGVIKGYNEDGNELGVVEVDAINVGDTEHSIDDLPKYIEIPDGTQTITLSVTPPVGTFYTQGVGGKIVFQVKVGA